MPSLVLHQVPYLPKEVWDQCCHEERVFRAFLDGHSGQSGLSSLWLVLKQEAKKSGMPPPEVASLKSQQSQLLAQFSMHCVIKNIFSFLHFYFFNLLSRAQAAGYDIQGFRFIVVIAPARRLQRLARCKKEVLLPLSKDSDIF